MASVRLLPLLSPLDATVCVPGSKSITNRALICAALAQGDSLLHNGSDSEDTALMMNALNQLGVLVRRAKSDLVVEGRGGRLFAPKYPVPVGNAGTTFRFLLSLAAVARGTTTFELSPRMAERPLDDLIEALRQAGVPVSRDVSGLYVHVEGNSLAGGRVSIRADRSSQFLSSLLLAAPYAREPMEIAVGGALASAPYAAMTLQVMAAFGVMVRADGDYAIPRGAYYTPAEYTVEADASGASYPLAAAAIGGGAVRVPGVREQSMQGDMGFAGLLREAGCTVKFSPEGVVVEGTGTPGGMDVDMNAMPDVVPTLAAVALFAAGPTRVRNVGHLRFKESNRLDALADELRKLGAAVTVHDDGFEIAPVPLHGATLSPRDDHRLAMSFALVGLRTEGIVIENPGCVRKSFPRFWEEFEQMTGRPLSFTQ